MIELQAVRKNKIHLADYNYHDDIKIRLLLSHFTSTDLEVLEEVLYSPVEFPLERLLQNLSIKEASVLACLHKFEEAGLLERSSNLVIVNKDRRKYFELELEKFDEDFEPGMEFAQNLLKRVPIQVLPNWYHIPRHSNNIFESIIEKYLITPQVFQRYLFDLNFYTELPGLIVHDVFSSAELEVSGNTLMRKYKLSQEEFEEVVLLLEFHFICCLVYRQVDDEWQEVVVPFQEWKEYLKFLQDSLPLEQSIDDVIPLRPNEYGFSKDLAELLMHIDRDASHFTFKGTKWSINPKIIPFLVPEFPQNHSCKKILSLPAYADHLLEKALLLGFAVKRSTQLVLTEAAFEWLEMGIEEKAIAIFKHPFHRIRSFELHSDRNIHEVENSLGRIAKLGWVLFDDFIKGSTIALKEDKKVRLKKEGRRWRYSLPSYSTDELDYLEAAVLGYLFESGIVRLGFIGSSISLRVTDLGRSLFEASV